MEGMLLVEVEVLEQLWEDRELMYSDSVHNEDVDEVYIHDFGSYDLEDIVDFIYLLIGV